MRMSGRFLRVIVASSVVFLGAFTSGAGLRPIPVETDDTLNALFPKTAIDASGNALAIWTRVDDENPFSPHNSLLANRYSVATRTWGNPTVLDLNGSGGKLVYDASIAVEPAGNAVVVWDRSVGAATNIFASRFVASANGGSWQKVVQIESDAKALSDQARVAVDGRGNAIAVWRRQSIAYGEDGSIIVVGASNIVAARYDVASNAWGPPVVLSTDQALGTDSPAIAISARGNAFVVWSQLVTLDGDSSLTRLDIGSSRFDAASGRWQSARVESATRRELLEIGRPLQDASLAKVGVDARGNAVAAWLMGQNQIRSSRFSAVTGRWSDAALVASDIPAQELDILNGPSLGVDADGNALVTWSQNDQERGTEDFTPVQKIRANRSSALNGAWGRPTTVSDQRHFDRDPRVAIGPTGDASVVWTQETLFDEPSQSSEPFTSVFRSRYFAATRTWSAPARLSDIRVAAAEVDAAVNRAGDSIAVWGQAEPPDFVRQSIFSLPCRAGAVICR